MRVLSYNILDGGTGRAELLGDAIEPQRPDVVALVEADDPGVVETLAGRLGMDFIHAPGNSHASALLSRLPIAETVNHAPMHAGLEQSLLEATVVVPGGAEMTLGVLHLHARPYEADEAVRERELDVILDVFRPHREAGGPHLLCGDFNANAPHQRIDLARCKEKTRLAWQANGGGLPRRVVQRLLDAGYLDTLYAFDPEAGATHATFTTTEPGQRVDYIFAHGLAPAGVRRAWVITDPPTIEASDHFPVAVDLG
jgi:endonuclease/exonuclease/phosphatase family metal-dependent hydrolase